MERGENGQMPDILLQKLFLQTTGIQLPKLQTGCHRQSPSNLPWLQPCRSFCRTDGIFDIPDFQDNHAVFVFFHHEGEAVIRAPVESHLHTVRERRIEDIVLADADLGRVKRKGLKGIQSDIEPYGRIASNGRDNEGGVLHLDVTKLIANDDSVPAMFISLDGFTECSQHKGVDDLAALIEPLTFLIDPDPAAFSYIPQLTVHVSSCI